jgi:uncharacterized membrane protein
LKIRNKTHEARRIFLFLLFFTSTLFLLGLHGSSGYAADKSFRYKEWNVDIVVNKDSTLNVTETHKEAVNGQWYGRYRNLYFGDNVLDYADIFISEGAQEYRRGFIAKGSVNEPFVYGYYDRRPANDYIEILWSIRAYNEDKTFTLKYKVNGGFYYYANGDKMQWKAVSENRDQSIDSVKVVVHLPESIELKKSDIGLSADGDSLTMKQTDKRTVVYKGKDLGPNTKFWVGVRFPKGYLAVNKALLALQRKSEAEEARANLAAKITVISSAAMVFLVFLASLLYWNKYGRQPRVPKFAEYLTEPPDDSPPAVVCYEPLGGSMNGVNATLVDLARRGYLKIWNMPDDTLFEKLAAKDGLRPYEEQLINDLFGANKTAELSSFKNTFYKNLRQIESMIRDEAVKAGFCDYNPLFAKSKFYGLAVVVFIFTAIFGFLALPGAGLGNLFAGASVTITYLISFSPVAALAAIGLILVIFGKLTPVKTAKAAEKAGKWKAFREYLVNIKKYGHAGKAQEIFERYLPYAVAFGLQAAFSQSFDAKDVSPPVWFQPYWYQGFPDQDRARTAWASEHPGETMPVGGAGSGGFDLNNMSDALTSTLNEINDTLTSSPPSASSSSGGFDSGGGGGFDSGGGGGFDSGGGGGGDSGGW